MNFFIGNQIGTLNLAGVIPEKISIRGLPEKSRRELELLDCDVKKTKGGHTLGLPTNYQMSDYLLVFEVLNQYSHVTISKKNQAFDIQIHKDE